jgi:hypothetical protein
MNVNARFSSAMNWFMRLAWIFHMDSLHVGKLFTNKWKKHMKKPEASVANSTQTAQEAARSTDYAAWLDHEGREHLITRDMVDNMIEELISSQDYSLQGSSIVLNPEQRTLRYSQNPPHWGE